MAWMTWAQLGFQDANSPIMEELIYFNDFSMLILVMIMSFVGALMIGGLAYSGVALTLTSDHTIECIWTVLPAVVLTQIAAPSLMLLYLMDDMGQASLTLKAVGSQWYWSYEYSGAGNVGHSQPEASYMDESGPLRLLGVDTSVSLPAGVKAQVLVTSEDVIHSWAMPAMGVKVDACPGRLNQLALEPVRPGVFFGQCSEICGANHSFMPIVLEVGSAADFISWLRATAAAGTT